MSKSMNAFFNLDDQLRQACEKLKQGDVIGLPTETVYGLAADIYSEEGVKKIFSLKERPLFDPLIVHVNSLRMAKELASDWNEVAELLAKKFWPGPLTLVMPKSHKVSNLITAGLETVGLRWPNHPVAKALLDQYQRPLCAPSANKFTKTSPSKSEHVSNEFPDVFILEGGDCQVGIESTILKFEVKNKSVQLKILRPGMISKQQIQEALSSYDCTFETKNNEIAPGNFMEHYRPESILVLTKEQLSDSQVLSQIALQSEIKYTSVHRIILAPTAIMAARELYSKLRENKDSKCVNLLQVTASMMSQEWEPILDRLMRAKTLALD